MQYCITTPTWWWEWGGRRWDTSPRRSPPCSPRTATCPCAEQGSWPQSRWGISSLNNKAFELLFTVGTVGKLNRCVLCFALFSMCTDCRQRRSQDERFPSDIVNYVCHHVLCLFVPLLQPVAVLYNIRRSADKIIISYSRKTRRWWIWIVILIVRKT